MKSLLKWYKEQSAWRRAFWLVIGILLLQGIYLTARRFILGLGATTNLSDDFPWGFWIGFDVISGVAFAAGGFTLCCLVYVFGYHRYHSIVRPTVLTAFLGYILVSIGLIYDLGKYYNIWHPIIMWNPHSVMFEVAWCVMLYSLVLFLEFLPVVLEKFNFNRPLKWLKKITIPLVIMGVILSTLHQSSLGSVFLIVPYKLHPLWWTPILPLLFFLSAVAVGPAIVIAESYFSSRVFNRGLELHILSDLARFLQVALIVYIGVKIQDLFVRGVSDKLLNGEFESTHFVLELAFPIVAIIILAVPRLRSRPIWLPTAAVLVVLGVLYNRFNIAWIGMMRSSRTSYYPAWSEIGVSLFLMAVGFVVFYLIVSNLKIFPESDNKNGHQLMLERQLERKRLKEAVASS